MKKKEKVEKSCESEKKNLILKKKISKLENEEKLISLKLHLFANLNCKH